ncbi:sulfotransferase domain-containing protein [Rubinisphaera margarita]|uniref:sulfotransferase domain-containing protein n=1 Tax=Rubinisphaera margarita TaxID=2909586 RepID=UPI001EE92A5C|nr:sulfotransferase domain-containing protein [Rubinisphaera margarita]MCG6154360.1 sulfotransferase domain-containing protein [Rubinisphaera margarita]
MSQQNALKDGSPRILYHACHHKCGTHWFKRLLQLIALRYDMKFCAAADSIPVYRPLILFDPQSRIGPPVNLEYRGTHMIRDPRDVVISGYFYHLWTNEEWATQPNVAYGGRSYQQMLQSLDQEDGLIEEIKKCRFVFKMMREWDYSNTNLRELKYEEAFNEPESTFTQVFQHYGIGDDELENCLQLSQECSFQAVAKRPPGVVQEQSVTRSGEPGQWTLHFTSRVKDEFRRQTGDLLQVLGYESSADW